jgi:competence protein ComFC
MKKRKNKSKILNLFSIEMNTLVSKLSSILSLSISNLADFFLPHICSICGDVDRISRLTGVCKNCHKEIPPNKVCRCEICSHLLVQDTCEFCDSRNIFYDKLIFLRIRTPKEKILIQRLKYHKERVLSHYFKMKLNQWIPTLKNMNFAYITSVPSHKTSEKYRDYSSIESLQKSLSKKLSKNIQVIVEKHSPIFQSGLGLQERYYNAGISFKIKKEWENNLKGNILILDDVFTTGATINEVSRIIKLNGASNVWCLVSLKGDDWNATKQT